MSEGTVSFEFRFLYFLLYKQYDLNLLVNAVSLVFLFPSLFCCDCYLSSITGVISSFFLSCTDIESNFAVNC